MKLYSEEIIREAIKKTCKIYGLHESIADSVFEQVKAIKKERLNGIKNILGSHKLVKKE